MRPEARSSYFSNLLSITEHLPKQIVYAAATLLPDLVHGLVQHQLATADEHHVVQDALHVGNEVGGDEQSGVRVEVGEDGVDDVVSGGGITPPMGSSSRYSRVRRLMTRISCTFSAYPWTSA